ncbi:hypothetical protein PoB_001352100 [Plakobranchus ocellatus]|uniref:Uncharacterized protein n=1 Tax=Plakobranchus ocellatus TaxID=259542 RepID=A0AAV3YUA9_9GAST|nr:hypothetical protein PoB_001352100 [Plakobranchus ocellatus]
MRPPPSSSLRSPRLPAASISSDGLATRNSTLKTKMETKEERQQSALAQLAANSFSSTAGLHLSLVETLEDLERASQSVGMRTRGKAMLHEPKRESVSCEPSALH